MTSDFASDFGTKKTVIVLAIVAGCFAVLWPKIFYPMLTGAAHKAKPISNSDSIRQERQTPPHAGSFHPAMRERGRAIPASHIVPRIEERGAIPMPNVPNMPKMRPPMGAPGLGSVQSQKVNNNSIGIIMPLYTIGIVIFFLYTISKVIRKSNESPLMPDCSSEIREREFQKAVFNPQLFEAAITAVNGKQEEQGDDIEIERLRQRLLETEAAMERIVVQMGDLSRSVVKKTIPQLNTKEEKKDLPEETCVQEPNQSEEFYETSPTAQVVNVEMTASCKSSSRPATPILLNTQSHVEEIQETPPKPIYLEGALPAQCELLVTDSDTQEIKDSDNKEMEADDEAPVVLSGKMSLSIISLEQISPEPIANNANAEEENSDEELQSNNTDEEQDELNKSSDEFEIDGNDTSDDADVSDHVDNNHNDSSICDNVKSLCSSNATNDNESHKQKIDCQ